MASSKLLNLILVLSLTISLLLSLHSHATFSPLIEDNNEEGSEYVLNTPVLLNFRSRSMSSLARIRKGAQCNSVNHNICDRVPANNGTILLHCCKKHCRNVVRDRNNCGRCGKRCSFGERCCQGSCTDVFHNVNHCGKCNNKCLQGDKCEYGYCGYA